MCVYFDNCHPERSEGPMHSAGKMHRSFAALPDDKGFELGAKG